MHRNRLMPFAACVLASLATSFACSKKKVGGARAAVLVYDIRAYGAKGDGMTDDTVAIQAAFNAVPASGGTVFIPAPPVFYLLSAPISIPSYVFVQVEAPPGGANIDAGSLPHYTALLGRYLTLLGPNAWLNPTATILKLCNEPDGGGLGNDGGTCFLTADQSGNVAALGIVTVNGKQVNLDIFGHQQAKEDGLGGMCLYSTGATCCLNGASSSFVCTQADGGALSLSPPPSTPADSWFSVDSPDAGPPQLPCWHFSTSGAAINYSGCRNSNLSLSGTGSIIASCPDGRLTERVVPGFAASAGDTTSGGETALANAPRFVASFQILEDPDAGFTNAHLNGIRAWCGMTNSSLVGNDDNSSANFVATRCSTKGADGGPDLNWQACSSDGIAQTCVDTGVACPLANCVWQDIGIDCSAVTSCDFLSNAVKVVAAKSDRLPVTDAGGLSPVCFIDPTAGAGAANQTTIGIIFERLAVKSR